MIEIKNETVKKNYLQLQVIRLTSKSNSGVKYKTKLLKINDRHIDKKIFVETNIKSNFILNKGDIIETYTKLYPFKNSDDFQYKFFMLSKNYYFKVYPYNYDRINIKKPYEFEYKIIKIRKQLLKSIHKLYPYEEAIFLGGILLGAREEIPDELKMNFNNSGLTHFIAVSGFNITILIVFFGFFIKFLPAYIRLVIIFIAIILFTLLVGPSVAVIRASIMGFVGYLVITFGRKGDNLSIILFTALLMTLYLPLTISYDVSFHLSFLAVVGIIYFQKYFDKKLNFISNILELRTAITLTLSALTLTLPIMIFSFGQVSVLVLITNVLVSWTIPFAMLFGFISIIVFQVSVPIATIIGFITYILLSWDIWVVNTFGGLSWSTIDINFGKYAGYLEVLYLLIISYLYLYFKKTKN